MLTSKRLIPVKLYIGLEVVYIDNINSLFKENYNVVCSCPGRFVFLPGGKFSRTYFLVKWLVFLLLICFFRVNSKDNDQELLLRIGLQICDQMVTISNVSQNSD